MTASRRLTSFIFIYVKKNVKVRSSGIFFLFPFCIFCCCRYRLPERYVHAFLLRPPPPPLHIHVYEVGLHSILVESAPLLHSPSSRPRCVRGVAPPADVPSRARGRRGRRVGRRLAASPPRVRARPIRGGAPALPRSAAARVGPFWGGRTDDVLTIRRVIIIIAVVVVVVVVILSKHV